jgi:hypothetical protein
MSGAWLLLVRSFYHGRPKSEKHKLAEGWEREEWGDCQLDFSGFERTWVTRVTGFWHKIPAKTFVKFRVAKAAKDGVLGVKKVSQGLPTLRTFDMLH